ncbi:MAG: 2-oxo-4-hydroxy-4-carboxy-5-ureidoimidazoline decarboxylase, partial [Gemmatimonadota bacterium]
MTTGREVVTALAALDAERRGKAFLSCCGSDAWASAMSSGWPFETDALLEKAADDAWWALTEADWLEAFGAHPRIGARDDADQWAGSEQAGEDEADPDTLAALAEESSA